MIPAAVIVALYLIAGTATLVTTRWDEDWSYPARVFLALALYSWAGFYTLTNVLSFDVLRMLSRWLHAPLAVAVTLIVLGRWYASR